VLYARQRPSRTRASGGCAWIEAAAQVHGRDGMSAHHGTPADGGFDLLKVIERGRIPPDVDYRGRTILATPYARLKIAPLGPTAACKVAVPESPAHVAFRLMELGTDGAVWLARCLLVLTHVALHASMGFDELQLRVTEIRGVIESERFDDNELLPALGD
jgi:hypothetical protein